VLALRIKGKGAIQFIFLPPCKQFEGSPICKACVHRPPEEGTPTVLDIKKEDDNIIAIDAPRCIVIKRGDIRVNPIAFYNGRINGKGKDTQSA